jgi:rare lipoprotein A
MGVLALALVGVGCGKKKPHVVPVAASAAPVPQSAAVPQPKAAPRPAPPLETPTVGQSERGVASWYGHPYHGRHAADGEIYDMETLVAAHRTLPFQTRVRVLNLTNGKTVDVRIIDRGPFINNRIIDLSHLAAQKIEMIGPGIAEVQLTVLSAPTEAGPVYFAVQVGAFAVQTNAERMVREMATAYGAAKLVERDGDPKLFRVVAGRAPSEDAARVLAQRIRAERGIPAFVVRLDP